MGKITVLVPDGLLGEVVAAVEGADQEETVSRFVRAAVRAELARRKEEKEA